MTARTATVAILTLLVAFTAAIEGGQRGWPNPDKKRTASAPRVTSRIQPIRRPQEVISGGSNGLYCTSPWDNGIAVHDLGFIPAGFNVTVLVEAVSDDFNPVAAIIAPTIGQAAANTIKTTTFYDDDSGGGRDPRLEFVAPQSGTYLLLINDLTDSVIGCYRYQVSLR
jgi:hypothetical protein